MEPHPSLHKFMDAYSKQLGWGHRVFRHNVAMLEMANDLYGEDGKLEVAFHIACDMGLVTVEDLRDIRHLHTRRATARQS